MNKWCPICKKYGVLEELEEQYIGKHKVYPYACLRCLSLFDENLELIGDIDDE